MWNKVYVEEHLLDTPRVKSILAKVKQEPMALKSFYYIFLT